MCQLLYSSTSSLSEALVSNRQEFLPWAMLRAPRQDDSGAVQRLDRVHKCWSVTFPTEVFTDFDGAVGSQSDEVPIKCRVMQGAQR